MGDDVVLAIGEHHLVFGWIDQNPPGRQRAITDDHVERAERQGVAEDRSAWRPSSGSQEIWEAQRREQSLVTIH
jgi:hypothetical protein